MPRKLSKVFDKLSKEVVKYKANTGKAKNNARYGHKMLKQDEKIKIMRQKCEYSKIMSMLKNQIA